MSALTAMRHDKRMKAFYERRTKGKPAKVAIVAVMRKMLVILNAMAESNSEYRVEKAIDRLDTGSKSH